VGGGGGGGGCLNWVQFGHFNYKRSSFNRTEKGKKLVRNMREDKIIYAENFDWILSLCTIVSSVPIKNPQGILKIFVIRSLQSSILFSRFIDIESIERTSNTCSTFGRLYVISLDLEFSYINVTNVFHS
jgi:hypothetical protein